MDLLEAQSRAFDKVRIGRSRIAVRFNWIPKKLDGKWRGFGRHLVLQKKKQMIHRERHGGCCSYTVWSDFQWWQA